MKKFENKEGIIIIDDFNLAMQILRSESFIVPDLLNFLDRLMNASGADLSVLRLFTNVSPFFLEGDRQIYLRKISQPFLGQESYDNWLPFFKSKIDEIIIKLKTVNTFDLIDCVSTPIFTHILKPFLGIYSHDEKTFDEKAIVLQRLIEPMLSLNKLKQVNKDLTNLMNNLNLELVVQQDSDSIFNQLLNSEYNLSLEEKKAYIVVLYAAIAPLAQTIINILVHVYESKEIITSKFFLENIDYYIWKCAAPIYIHRVSLKDIELNELKIKKGNTVLIDIASSYKNLNGTKNQSCPFSERDIKTLPFGNGKHHCLGAFLSKSLISEFIPRFLDNLNLEIIDKEKDNTNHIANSYAYVKVKINNLKE